MKDLARYIARPWTFKFEMSRGCNLACKFCVVFAHKDIFADPERRKFMKPKLMRKIARECNELNPTARIELAARGEPTLNPYLLENLAIMREEMPKAQISLFTNGVRFLKEVPELGLQMLDAGLNILNIDCYNNTYDRFETWAKAQIGKEKKKVTTLSDFRQFSAYHKHSSGHKLRVINLVPDIAELIEGKPHVAVRVLHNAAGNVDEEEMERRYGVPPFSGEPLKKKCVRPAREFQVQFDGRVVICCVDWMSTSVMGDLKVETAHEIWYSKTHLAILRAMYKGDRSGKPCDKCSYKGGFRQGFLQNPFKPKD